MSYSDLWIDWSETEQIYRRAGFGGRMGYGKNPAIIVVDLQKGVTDPTFATGGGIEEAVRHTQQVVEVAHEEGFPVIFTRIALTPNDGYDYGTFLKKNPNLKQITIDSKWAELDDAFTLQPGDYLLTKPQTSAFFGTPLNTILISRSIDTLIITGASTGACVRATVFDACQYGYHTIVPRECVGDRSRIVHEVSLYDMDAKNADVEPVEQVIVKLRELGVLSRKEERICGDE